MTRSDHTRHRCAGMNIFEFLAFVLLIAGIVWGIFAAADQGLWAALKGGLFGAGKAYLIWIAIMLAIMVPLALGLRYRPMFPGCRKGKCKDRNFRILYVDDPIPEREAELQKQHQGTFVRCACGDIYLRSDRDRKFYEFRDDGTLIPFMKYRFAGRWQQDQ